jgi:hypothetical protein
VKDLDDPKWVNYFFRTHSRAELEEWTTRMRFFRFCRAMGGFANDPDILLCALRVQSEAELIHLTQALGIPLQEVPTMGQTVQLGRNRPTPIEAFPRFVQPGRVQLAETDCYAWVGKDRLELTVAGAAAVPYEVDVNDVEVALKIEAILAPFAGLVIDPPNETRCFTLQG